MPADRERYEVLYLAGGAHLSRAPSPGSVLSGVLLPASLVYAGASEIARRARMKGRRKTVNAVVVSIGNLEVGGNGKTPFAAHLVNELALRGHRTVYVSRGFKSEAEGLGVVTIVAPRSVEPSGPCPPGVRILGADAPGLGVAIGDEGAMVASRCPGAPLAFARNRRRALEAVSTLFAPTHVVLDDAFQTWPVARDTDIVLLDAACPLGNGRIIPAGSLRERAGALRRADAIGFNGIENDVPLPGTAGRGGEGLDERLSGLRDWTRRTVRTDVPVFGIRRRLSFLAPEPVATGPFGGKETEAPGRPAAALSSVGRPRRFEESLALHGIAVNLALRFPDHYRYRAECVRRIDEALASRGIEVLVTTEKDWAKLREVGPPKTEVRIARLHLDIVGDDPVSLCEKPRG